MDVCSGHLDRPHHGDRLRYHCGTGSHRCTRDLENWVDEYGGGDELSRSGDRGLLPDILRSNVLVKDSHHRCGYLGSGGRGDGVRGDKYSDLIGRNGARGGGHLYD